jgi:hypothetical protein
MAAAGSGVGLIGWVGLGIRLSFLKTEEQSFIVNHKSTCFSEYLAFYDNCGKSCRMTPSQCRAARGLLDWTQGDLAKASGVSDVTIRNFERSKSALQPASLHVLRSALEAAGVEFIPENGNGPGVRLAKRKPG